jgi:hypothetical protein
MYGYKHTTRLSPLIKGPDQSLSCIHNGCVGLLRDDVDDDDDYITTASRVVPTDSDDDLIAEELSDLRTDSQKDLTNLD